MSHSDREISNAPGTHLAGVARSERLSHAAKTAIHSQAGSALTDPGFETTKRLTDVLAQRVMGWKTGPDRFTKSGRSWIPKWRFSPLTDLNDAFQLLERTNARYTLTSHSGTDFTASVQIGERNGSATGQSKAQVITTAITHALGLEDYL